ncbi:hypothetical protein B0H13DRAFT_2304277 [Mycena leptocephala]|nr:hypothetical protein B0H13DRAFT_2304277 [Mycena leptocephala]
MNPHALRATLCGPVCRHTLRGPTTCAYHHTVRTAFPRPPVLTTALRPRPPRPRPHRRCSKARRHHAAGRRARLHVRLDGLRKVPAPRARPQQPVSPVPRQLPFSFFEDHPGNKTLETLLVTDFLSEYLARADAIAADERDTLL